MRKFALLALLLTGFSSGISLFAQNYPDGTLLTYSDGIEVFVIVNGYRCFIPDGQTLAAGPWNGKAITALPVAEMEKIPVGNPIRSVRTDVQYATYPDGTVIKMNEGPTLWVIVGGTRCILPDWATFQNSPYFKSENQWKKVAAATMERIVTGFAIPSIKTR